MDKQKKFSKSIIKSSMLFIYISCINAKINPFISWIILNKQDFQFQRNLMNFFVKLKVFYEV